MKVLAADTSTNIISIAVTENSKTKAMMHEQFNKSCGTSLVPNIDKLLKEAGFGIQDIDLLCIGTGPGSFTGLRASVATMRSMSIALNKPLIGIPSFDVIAHGIIQTPNSKLQTHNSICIMSDARQNKIYARFYKYDNGRLEPQSDFLLDSIENVANNIDCSTIIAGDAITKYKEQIQKQKKDLVFLTPEELWYPRADILAELGFVKNEQGYKDDPFTLLPLYIYPKECQIRKV